MHKAGLPAIKAAIKDACSMKSVKKYDIVILVLLIFDVPSWLTPLEDTGEAHVAKHSGMVSRLLEF